MQTRKELSDSVTHLGWRYVLGAVRTSVAVGDIAEAARAATLIADGQLSIDLRADHVLIATRDVELAAHVTSVLKQAGYATVPGPVQALELAIDALDIPAVRPFWKAALAYRQDDDGALSDPAGQGPAVWFQQMDSPRPQRNRIHFDISVPHDAARARIDSALAAGGILVSDKAAPAFWVLADVEGNEACICTWEGRD
jgi:4a-hydroxytetrahydrobiopterin dehydratase